ALSGDGRSGALAMCRLEDVSLLGQSAARSRDRPDPDERNAAVQRQDPLPPAPLRDVTRRTGAYAPVLGHGLPTNCWGTPIVGARPPDRAPRSRPEVSSVGPWRPSVGCGARSGDRAPTGGCPSRRGTVRRLCPNTPSAPTRLRANTAARSPMCAYVKLRTVMTASVPS